MTAARRTGAAVALATLLLATGCSRISSQIETITLLTHDAFHLPQESLDAFTERTGVRVAVIREPDAAAVVELLSRTSENPIADVVVGIDSLSVAQVLRERLVLPHRAIEADRLDPSLLIDDDELTPISYLDVCLNVDLTSYAPPPPSEEELAELAVEAARLAAEAAEAEERGEEVPEPLVDDSPPLADPPTTIRDLTELTYFGQLVLPDPASDRMGEYFVVALHHRFGEGSIDDEGNVQDSWIDVAKALLLNGAGIRPTWRDAYFGAFTEGSADGDRTVVVATAQMPAVAASLRFDPPERLETGSIDDGCLRVVSYAGIVTGTNDRRAGGRLIDQMISPEFQFNVGDSLGSQPARADLIISELMETYGAEVEVALVDPMSDGDDLAEWVGIWGLVVEDARRAIVVQPATEPEQTDP